MPTIAAGFGALIAVLGLLGLVSPALLRRLVARLRNRGGMWFATGIRLVFGAIIIWVAPESRAPVAFYVLGALMVATAGILPALGTSWFSAMLGRWLRWRDLFVRGWAVVALALGVLVAYGAWP